MRGPPAMGATDSILARLQGEAEERAAFMDKLVEAAEKDERDLTEQEMVLLARTRERIQEVTKQIEPLREAVRIAQDSQNRTKEIAEEFAKARNPEAAKLFEYRSAGQYVMDVWRSRLGVEEAQSRLELYHRAAAHQTTGDNPGLI